MPAVFEQRHQFTALHMRFGHVVREPEDAHARHASSQVSVAVVHGDHVAALHFDLLVFALHGDGRDLAAA